MRPMSDDPRQIEYARYRREWARAIGRPVPRRPGDTRPAPGEIDADEDDWDFPGISLPEPNLA